MAQRHQHSRLLEPIRIGSLKLKNRIVMLPLENNYASEDGAVTDRLEQYYRARSRDVGLVIVQITAIDSPIGRSYPFQLCIHEDRTIQGLSELAATIHREGAKTIIQLNHAGVSAQGGHPTVAASPIPYTDSPAFHDVTPRQLTATEIGTIVRQYARAAERARQAGFDGVEVVASGGYLIWGFLSPTWNKRNDDYGGELPNRARILIQVIQAIKRALGSGFPVTCRLAVKEYGAKSGLTTKESQQIAKWAEAAGLDAITQTAIGDGALTPLVPGALIPLASALKQVVKIPVTVAGRMTLDVGERAIEEGKADLVGIGRQLLADPAYVSKTLAGRSEDVVPCIACHECVQTFMVEQGPLRCAVNPACGNEGEYASAAPAKPKKVLVIGGGPAGMAAAIVAAGRGHQVTLYEREPELGGQLASAVIAPGKDRIQPLSDYLATQVRRLPIKLNLGTRFEPAMIETERPEVVILATGLRPFVPDIPGIEHANVVHAEDVLTGRSAVGMEVAIIGGQSVGCETADFLAQKGIKVTVMVRSHFLTKTNPTLGRRLLDRLRRMDVVMLDGVTYEKFESNSLFIRTKVGDEMVVEADTFVLAAGSIRNTDLLEGLRDLVPETCCVGDCVQPRNLMAAIAEGFRAGHRL